MQGEIVIVLKGMQLSSYSSHPTIPFSLSSSSFNHTCSMHSIHLLPYLNLEKSIFGGLSPIASTWGRPRTFLRSSGTQNSNSSSWPTIHSSFMPCGTGSYSWIAFLCLAARSTMSWILAVWVVWKSGKTPIFNKRRVQLLFLVPALSIQMAGVGIISCVIVANSVEPVTKRSVI